MPKGLMAIINIDDSSFTTTFKKLLYFFSSISFTSSSMTQWLSRGELK